jgi:anaerobic magnesium-protoporphyrin IX monomethyl ester cyclase
MRVVFINPPSGLERDFYEIPLNIAYLIACSRARHVPVEFEVIDMELYAGKDPWEHLEARGTANEVGVIAAPLYTYSLDACLRAVAKMKTWHPRAVSIVGGPHATLAPQEMIRHPAVDVLVTGEGDIAFVDVLEAILAGPSNVDDQLSKVDGIAVKRDGKVSIKPRRSLIKDLDQLPLATGGYDCFDLSEVRRLPNFVPVMATRGCPYQCTFCSSSDLWQHRIHFRSPANIRQELEEIVALGFRVVNFRDDMFSIRRQRTIELCDVTSELGLVWGCETRADCVDEELLQIMVDGGLCTIRFGIETFHQKSLDLLKKQEKVEELIQALELCGKVGVPEVRCSFMIGIPGETEEDVKETFKIVRSFPFTTNRFWAFTPVVGTEAFVKMDELGLQWLVDPKEKKATHSIIKTREMSNDQINRLVQQAHLEFGHPLTKPHRDLQAAPRILAARDHVAPDCSGSVAAAKATAN